jgi:hypothetical protein
MAYEPKTEAHVLARTMTDEQLTAACVELKGMLQDRTLSQPARQRIENAVRAATDELSARHPIDPTMRLAPGVER